MKIFTKNDIEFFNKYWEDHLNSDRSKFYEKFHRLNNVTKIFPWSKDEVFKKYLKPLEEITKFNLSSYYMLEYTKGSYTEIHSDHQSDLTWATLLYKSDDLDGGEILIKKNNKIQIKKLEIGESCYYSNEFEHGVSEVIQGIRRVLIVWMKK